MVETEPRILLLHRALDSILDQGLTPAVSAGAFWERVHDSPVDLATGIELLASREGTIAQTMLKKFVGEAGLHIRRQPRLSKLLFSVRAAETAIYVLYNIPTAQNPTTQETLSSFVDGLFNGWNIEEKIILLSGIVTKNKKKQADGNVSVTLRPPLNKRIIQMIEEVTLETRQNLLWDDTDSKQPTEKALKLACLLCFSQLGLLAENPQQSGNIRIGDIARNWLNQFLRHGLRSEESCLQALETINMALSKDHAIAKDWIVDFLTGEVEWDNPVIDSSGINQGIEFKSLAPFLHRLFALLQRKDDNLSQKSQEMLENLLDATAVTHADTTGSIILTRVIASNKFSDAEIVTILKHYFIHKGYEINPDYSFEKFLPLFKRPQWRLLIDLKEGTIAFEGDDRIVLKKARPSKAAEMQTATVEPNSTAAEVATDAPATPRPTQLAEPIQLTEEEGIVEVLKKVFSANLTDEDIKTLETRSRELWGEIDLRNQKRTASFDPDGTAVILRLDRIRRLDDASSNGYPRIVFKRQQPNGSLSDIAGTIFLTSDVILPFAINNQGELEGRPEALFVDGTISYENYLQLQHAVLSLAHKLLRRTDEELAERAVRARQHVEGEIAVGGRVVREKLQGALDRSLAYLVQVGYAGQPIEGQELTIDLDKVRNELMRGKSSVSVYCPINPMVMDDLRHQARSGQANPNPSGGRLVLLPKGYQPSRKAIDNAERFGMSIVQVTVFNLNDTGLLEWVTFLTTFRSFPERKTHAA